MNNDISILSFFADLAYSNDSEVTINNNLIANPNPNISKYNVIALNRGINGFQASRVDFSLPILQYSFQIHI